MPDETTTGADSSAVCIFNQQAIDQYVKLKLESGVKPETIPKYGSALNSLLNWLADDPCLTPQRLQQWRKYLEQAGYSKYSIQAYVRVMNNFFRTCGYAQLCIPKPLRDDLTGKTFGYLTVIGPTERRYKRNVIWQCRCKCGNLVETTTGALQAGRIASCGCLKKEILLYDHRYVNDTELKKSLRNVPENPNNQTGYTGVQPKGNKWIAYITYKKKKYHLGTFYKLEDAVKARARAKELVMEDAQRLYDETSDLFQHKPCKPPKPEKK